MIWLHLLKQNTIKVDIHVRWTHHIDTYDIQWSVNYCQTILSMQRTKTKRAYVSFNLPFVARESPFTTYTHLLYTQTHTRIEKLCNPWCNRYDGPRRNPINAKLLYICKQKDNRDRRFALTGSSSSTVGRCSCRRPLVTLHLMVVDAKCEGKMLIACVRSARTFM